MNVTSLLFSKKEAVEECQLTLGRAISRKGLGERSRAEGKRLLNSAVGMLLWHHQCAWSLVHQALSHKPNGRGSSHEGSTVELFVSTMVTCFFRERQ